MKENQDDYSNANWDPMLRLVIKETMAFWETMDQIESNAFGQSVKCCQNCKDKPPEKQCIQTVVVEANNDPVFRKKWEGCGITCVPKDQCMKPRAVSQNS